MEGICFPTSWLQRDTLLPTTFFMLDPSANKGYSRVTSQLKSSLKTKEISRNKKIKKLAPEEERKRKEEEKQLRRTLFPTRQDKPA